MAALTALAIDSFRFLQLAGKGRLTFASRSSSVSIGIFPALRNAAWPLVLPRRRAHATAAHENVRSITHEKISAMSSSPS